MRSREAVIHCDGDDGLCGDWSFDYYEQTASLVGGVRITPQERAPGWTSTKMDDFCPEHKPLIRPAPVAGHDHSPKHDCDAECPVYRPAEKGCTCGRNGTVEECAAELAAGGWCPRAREVREQLSRPGATA